MWPNRILQSPGSRKNCRVRSSRTGGPEVRRGLWREQSSQAGAKDQGREAVEGLFLFTLSPRASLAYRTAVDRESQPIVNQRSGASRARPLAKLLCQLGSFSFRLRAAQRISRAPGTQKKPRNAATGLSAWCYQDPCCYLSVEGLYCSCTWPRALCVYQILIEKVVENASLNVQALDPARSE